MSRRRRLLLLLLASPAIILGLAAGPAAAAVPNPPNDPRFGDQPGLIAIKAPEVWAKGTGAGIKVAIVSTGIAKDHPDLVGKVGGGLDATGGDAPTDDIDGRGTHLAGIVGAATNNGKGIAGVAPDVQLLPYRAFQSGDTTVDGEAYLRALAEAGKGSQVILVDVPSGFPADKRPQLTQLIQGMGARGISVVVGAQSGISPGPAVLMVAATADGAGDQGVGAPDRALSTTVTRALVTDSPTYDYATVSGTNRSAAHAAGAVAILRGSGLGASSARAAELLRSTKTAGAGVIDLAAAAAALKPPPVAQTTTTTPTKKGAPAPPTTASTATTALASGPIGPFSGPAFDSETELGAGQEEAVVPPGAENFLDPDERRDGSSILIGGKERPWIPLTAGFGLLFGVGSALSLTFRRLGAAPT